MPPNVSLQIVCYHLLSLQNANLMCSTLYVHQTFSLNKVFASKIRSQPTQTNLATKCGSSMKSSQNI